MKCLSSRLLHKSAEYKLHHRRLKDQQQDKETEQLAENSGGQGAVLPTAVLSTVVRSNVGSESS
jgi:hypothetical protein